MRDADALADVVVQTVKAAQGPGLERIAALEAQVKMLTGTIENLLGLRDRIVTLETKGSAPWPVVPDPAVVELRQKVDGVDERIADDIAALRERVAVIEVREGTPGPPGPAGKDGRDGKDGVDATNTDLTKELSALRERMAVVEVKGQVAGPPGPAGKDGKDGVDGVGFDDLSVVHDGERTFTIKMLRGDRAKDVGTFTVPAVIYRGVYLDGKTYDSGDLVTWAGSTWSARKTTTMKPGEGSDDWQLCVKRGRDGKDGRDGAGGLPVVSVGSRSWR